MCSDRDCLTHTHTHTTHTHTHTCRHAHAYMGVHAHTHTHKHHTHARTHARTHTHMQVCTCIHGCTCTHTHTHHTHTHTHTHTHMQACTCIHGCTCTHTHHTHTHTHTTWAQTHTHSLSVTLSLSLCLCVFGSLVILKVPLFSSLCVDSIRQRDEKNTFALTLSSEGQPRHYFIAQKKDSRYSIEDGPRFDCLMMVSYMVCACDSTVVVLPIHLFVVYIKTAITLSEKNHEHTERNGYRCGNHLCLVQNSSSRSAF